MIRLLNQCHLGLDLIQLSELNTLSFSESRKYVHFTQVYVMAFLAQPAMFVNLQK